MTPPDAARSKVTRQGAAVEEVLADLGGFHTAQSLHDELKRRAKSVGLTTVYRQLKRLTAAGTVDLVTRPDGETAYRLCGPATSAEEGHHHHLVCRTCGYTVEIEGPEVERWAGEVARRAGFTDVSHTVELFGECDRH